MVAEKTLLDDASLFFHNDCQKNKKIIYKYFKDKYGKIKRKHWLQTEKIDETRNYFLDEIKQNELKNEKHTKVYMALNYFEHFLIFVSAVSGCVSIPEFVSLVSVSVGIAISVVEFSLQITKTGSSISAIRSKPKQLNSCS